MLSCPHSCTCESQLNIDLSRSSWRLFWRAKARMGKVKRGVLRPRRARSSEFHVNPEWTAAKHRKEARVDRCSRCICGIEPFLYARHAERRDAGFDYCVSDSASGAIVENGYHEMMCVAH